MTDEEDETLYSFKNVKMMIHHQNIRRLNESQQYQEAQSEVTS